jgi:hypothetical protein
MSNSSRQRVALATIVVFCLAFNGCLTIDPAVTADASNAAVFEIPR